MFIKNQLKHFFILIFTIIITLGLSISLQSLLASWVAPSVSPPDGNIPEPINSSLNNQIKLGGLGMGGNFAVSGMTTLQGGLIIEKRTSDPATATTGQIWLRTDLP